MSQKEDEGKNKARKSKPKTEDSTVPVTVSRTVTALRSKRRLEIPMPIPNNLLKSYANMYMNTINAADFLHLQKYLNTFLTGTCPFVISLDAHRSTPLPQQQHGISPKALAHYYLGAFVMCPDVIVRMKRANLVRSRDATGAPTVKVVMHLHSEGTIVCTVNQQLWMPALPDATSAAKAHKRRKAEAGGDAEVVANISAMKAFAQQPRSPDTSNAAAALAALRNAPVALPPLPAPTPAAMEAPATAAAPLAASAASATALAALTPASAEPTFIPKTYALQLMRTAAPLNTPKRIVLSTVLTMHLTEDLMVHHFTMDMKQEFG